MKRLNSTDAEVAAIKAKFNALLESLPAPVLAEEGAPNERARSENEPRTRAKPLKKGLDRR
jgi:hypothetical protein